MESTSSQIENVTWAERGKILGHKSTTVFQENYLDPHSAVDLQSLACDRTPHTQQLGFLRGIGASRFPGAPSGFKDLPKDVQELIRNHPDLKACRDEACHNISNDIFERQAKKNLMDITRRRLINNAIAQCREEFFRDCNLHGLSSREDGSQEPAHTLVLSPERASIVKCFYYSTDGTTGLEALQLFHNLYAAKQPRKLDSYTCSSKGKKRNSSTEEEEMPAKVPKKLKVCQSVETARQVQALERGGFEQPENLIRRREVLEQWKAPVRPGAEGLRWKFVTELPGKIEISEKRMVEKFGKRKRDEQMRAQVATQWIESEAFVSKMQVHTGPPETFIANFG